MSVKRFVWVLAFVGISSGCAPLLLSAAYEPTISPTADLSCDSLRLPRAFAGIALGVITPESSSLQKATVYDFNLTYDLNRWLAVELLVGSWTLPDRPSNIPNADSNFQLTPCLAMAQIYKDFAKLRGRLYVGAGAGYAQSDYNLGSSHKQYVMDQDGLSDYDLVISDGAVFQAAVGWEAYSTADAKLNLGLELRYLSADLNMTIRRPDVPDYEASFPADKLWLIRANLTWHF